MKGIIEAKIERLIATAPVVAFIKGTPGWPLDHHSALVVELLENANLHYKSINVMEDRVLRDAMRDYADWPAFPQVYINGHLIGGASLLQEVL